MRCVSMYTIIMIAATGGAWINAAAPSRPQPTAAQPPVTQLPPSSVMPVTVAPPNQLQTQPQLPAPTSPATVPAAVTPMSAATPQAVIVSGNSVPVPQVSEALQLPVQRAPQPVAAAPVSPATTIVRAAMPAPQPAVQSTLAPTSATAQQTAAAKPSPMPPAPQPAVLQPTKPAIQPVAQPQPVPAPVLQQVAPKPTTTAVAAPLPVPTGDAQMLTTKDLAEPAGNWLYKRIWWENAQQLYEKIKQKVDQIFELRIAFFNKRTELDRTLFDPFYINAGVGRGELEELLNYFMSGVEAQRAKQGQLNEQERAFLDLMNKEKQTLEQLKLDIQAITKLDNAIDDSVAQLMDQLQKVRGYERQAWENFKTIAEVLNDKKARELYYGMVSFDENINAIDKYIRMDLTQYFDQLVKTSVENVTSIKASLNALKEKGIDFKKKAKELEQKDTPAQKARREAERIEREEEEAREEEAKTWTGWTKQKLGSVWQGISDFFGGIYIMITGLFSKKESTEDESKEQVRPPAAPMPPQPKIPTMPTQQLTPAATPETKNQVPSTSTPTVPPKPATGY